MADEKIKLYRFIIDGYKNHAIASDEETSEQLAQLDKKRVAFVETSDLEELLRKYNLDRLIPMIKEY